MLKKIVAGLMLLASLSFGMSLSKLNSATKVELMAINGVGEVKAAEIIKQRRKGKFKSFADLQERVDGIGEQTAANIKGDVKNAADVKKVVKKKSTKAKTTKKKMTKKQKVAKAKADDKKKETKAKSKAKTKVTRAKKETAKKKRRIKKTAEKKEELKKKSRKTKAKKTKVKKPKVKKLKKKK